MSKDFDQLTRETHEKIKEFGIKSSTVFKVFNQACREIGWYLEDNDIEFSLDNGLKWLSEVLPDQPMTSSQRNMHSTRHRVVQLLSECQSGKLSYWKTYWQKPAARPKNAEYMQLLCAHEQKLKAEGMAKSTISSAIHVGSDFLIYLEASGKHEIQDIDLCDVTGYFAQDKYAGRKSGGVKANAYKLKSFLAFLEETGIVSQKKLSMAVPKVFAKQVSIVTVLSDKAVSELRSGAVKPEGDVGFRNHTTMLLALRLGIRRSDIFKLRLADIDWANDSMSFVQQKTGVPVTLPLLPDVGNALMEYILKYRPTSSSDFVFLRNNAPHQALAADSEIAKNYLSVFESEDCPQKGFHILRRTFSTKMLQNNIPRSVISSAAGQLDPNSIDVYLSADEKNMRKCALSLKGIECARGDLR